MAGQGADTADFADYEGRKGLLTVRTRADWYSAWFDLQGAMAQERALRANPALFALLPPNARSRFEQPDASHTQAPSVAREQIAVWLRELALKGL